MCSWVDIAWLPRCRLIPVFETSFTQSGSRSFGWTGWAGPQAEQGSCHPHLRNSEVPGGSRGLNSGLHVYKATLYQLVGLPAVNPIFKSSFFSPPKVLKSLLNPKALPSSIMQSSTLARSPLLFETTGDLSRIYPGQRFSPSQFIYLLSIVKVHPEVEVISGHGRRKTWSLGGTERVAYPAFHGRCVV